MTGKKGVPIISPDVARIEMVKQGIYKYAGHDYANHDGYAFDIVHKYRQM